MQTQTLCAAVARRLGEPLRLIERRGFQPLAKRPRSPRFEFAAVDCPFCGQQVLVAPSGPRINAECHGCDVSFEATGGDLYRIALDQAAPARDRRMACEST